MMDFGLKFGRVLNSFNYYTEVLLQIQLQKAKVAGQEFNINEFSKLRGMLSGKYQWHNHGKLNGLSEVKIVEIMGYNVKKLLNSKDRIIQHIFYVGAKTTKAETLLYFHLLAVENTPFNEIDELKDWNEALISVNYSEFRFALNSERPESLASVV